jgi:hypothetical protein
MHCRRLTRLTTAFGKKLENIMAAVALNFVYYNFWKLFGSFPLTLNEPAGFGGRTQAQNILICCCTLREVWRSVGPWNVVYRAERAGIGSGSLGSFRKPRAQRSVGARKVTREHLARSRASATGQSEEWKTVAIWRLEWNWLYGNDECERNSPGGGGKTAARRHA